MSGKGLNWFDGGKTYFKKHLWRVLRSDVYARKDSLHLFVYELLKTVKMGVRR